MHAFAEVAPLRRDVDLLLAGDGALRETLEQLTRDLGIDARVRFLGVRSDVADLLRASDVFALTSVSEAASITLLEAMARRAAGGRHRRRRQPGDRAGRRGRPARAARGRARRSPRRSSACSTTAAWRYDMGQAGAERVRTHYRLDHTIERYYALYRGVPAARQAA